MYGQRQSGECQGICGQVSVRVPGAGDEASWMEKDGEYNCRTVSGARSRRSVAGISYERNGRYGAENRSNRSGSCNFGLSGASDNG